MRALFALILMASALPAAAVTKCVAADNSVTYTDGPCPAGSAAKSKLAPPPALLQEDIDRAAAELARLQQQSDAADAAQQRREQAVERQRARDEALERQAAAQALAQEKQELLRRQTEAMERMQAQPNVVFVPVQRPQLRPRPQPPSSTPKAVPAEPLMAPVGKRAPSQ